MLSQASDSISYWYFKQQSSEISSDFERNTKSKGQHESSEIQTRKMKADKKKYRAEKRVALMGENQIVTVSACSFKKPERRFCVE